MLKLRIAYLMRRTVGGMQTHLIDLISRLDGKNFEIFVIAPPSKQLEDKLKDLDVNFIPVDIEDKLRPWRDFTTVLKLRKAFKKLKPQVLHIHGNKSALVGRFAAMFLSYPAKVVVTVHNYLIYQEATRFKRVIASYVERFLANRTNAIITVSDGLKKSLVSVEEIPEEKIITIPNGIDVSDWDKFESDGSFKESLELPEEVLVIGTVGRLVFWKGHSVLLDALPSVFSKFPHARAVIVGDGPERKELKRKTKELGVEGKVLFPGFIPDIKPALSTFDIFILPSLKEPFGIVLLEAMAARCPIVATRAGGVPEIIESNKTGILVPPGNAQALAEAIEAMFLQPDLKKKLIGKAYEVVRENFSIDNMVKRTTDVYYSCTGKN